MHNVILQFHFLQCKPEDDIYCFFFIVVLGNLTLDLATIRQPLYH
jgi:hypothetical protein